MTTRTQARRSPGRAALTIAACLTLAAPLVVPAYLGTATVAGYWTKAPESVPPIPLAEPSVLYASDGVTELATLYLFNRDVVPHEQISPLAVDALVSTEDVRFYDHDGVDPVGIARAVKTLAQGGAQQGGSTLTQQYVKMVLASTGYDLGNEELAAAATEDSIWRKLREAKLALGVEKEMTKDDVVAGYLNLAYFGAGAYGIQAASQRYFSVDAIDLTLPQAALLVGLVNNPSRLDPTVNPEGALKRRNLVLDRMLSAAAITTSEHSTATATELALVENVTANGCAAGPAPMFCDWVRAELENEPALGDTPEERRARLLQGGLKVTTTLDLKLQADAQNGVDKHVPADHDAVAAQVLVEPGSGDVKAMVSTRPYGNGEGQSVIGFGSKAAFQPGSTFKAFTLLAALEARMPLDTRLPGGDRHTSKIFANPTVGYFQNSGDGAGTNLTLERATAQSVNTAFVQLQERVGTKTLADVAHRAGITSITADMVAENEGSLTLGARETSPLQVANAYATIAAHGRACEPRGATSILTSDGTELLTGPRCTQQFSPAVADTTAALLGSVTTDGGSGTRGAVPGHQVAGKTGTTQGFGAAWFAGFTPALSSAVWIGDPRGPSHSLTNTLGERRLYGGTVPADIFSTTLTAALTGQPSLPLPSVNPTYLVTSRPK